ncbi:type IV pilus inner membrane component PilO [Marinobacterium arenosum]|uniref:type 4a pilus biogenesis protein PilO n=1 Tax=Marinobacterium arenosum TaxID=2862496 RepID=UPI001C946E2B|nr:type 4a pilus biogenesis protein PilO [Marinobacterium arenosum]MBY4675588.1 type 4a pilus biogenesis protein PilO [Marinobacterium arenosum]
MNADSFKNAFKGFDPNNLDLSTAGNWPIGVKLIAYLLVFGALVAAGINYYTVDKYRALEHEMRKELELKQLYEAKSFQVANLPALRQQMMDVEERFAELLKQLPTDKEVPGLLDDITNIGRESGLQIEEIALGEERKAEFYVELPINIKVRGNYHEMGEFVSGIAAIPRIVTLHDFSIVPSSGKLLMTIDARTYRYDDEY